MMHTKNMLGMSLNEMDANKERNKLIRKTGKRRNTGLDQAPITKNRKMQLKYMYLF